MKTLPLDVSFWRHGNTLYIYIYIITITITITITIILYLFFLKKNPKYIGDTILRFILSQVVNHKDCFSCVHAVSHPL
jgi:hypothetical protein